MQRFPLAPMSGLFVGLTLIALALPPLTLWLGYLAGAAPALLPLAGFLVLVYLFVWLYMRPSGFELSEDRLDIVWPLRRLSVPVPDITGVEVVSGAEFRARYGWGVRIGAGGLWGGFGLLKTRRVTFRFYISRLDELVIVERRSDRPLLVTPAGPEAFVRTLELGRSYRKA